MNTLNFCNEVRHAFRRWKILYEQWRCGSVARLVAYTEFKHRYVLVEPVRSQAKTVQGYEWPNHTTAAGPIPVADIIKIGTR